MLSIECPPHQESEPCECCGGLTAVLTRFVYLDGNAHAIYYARFTRGHPERVVVATIGLGDWSEDSTPADRVAFAFYLRVTAAEFQVSLIDRDQSPWCNAKTIGRTLNREEAVAHPFINDAYHVIDHMVADDSVIREYLEGICS